MREVMWVVLRLLVVVLVCGRHAVGSKVWVRVVLLLRIDVVEYVSVSVVAHVWRVCAELALIAVVVGNDRGRRWWGE